MPDNFAMLKEARTPINDLKALTASLNSKSYSVKELEDIYSQLHADFFLTACALDSKDREYINTLRLSIAVLFRVLFRKAKKGASR